MGNKRIPMYRSLSMEYMLHNVHPCLCEESIFVIF
jgi:hypothetical protein